jgi:hypothetical protein
VLSRHVADSNFRTDRIYCSQAVQVTAVMDATHCRASVNPLIQPASRAS